MKAIKKKKDAIKRPKIKVTLKPSVKAVTRADPAARSMHRAVVSTLQSWVDGLDDAARDKPIVGSAGTVAITPRTLVEHVTTRTPIGRRYLDSVQRLAVRQVLQKFGGSEVK
jgi:hypothetical protein